MNLSRLARALPLAALVAATPAFADAIVDNVTGLTLDKQQRVVRFKALILDKDGRVVRLVPPNEQPPKPTRKDPGPRYDWRADMGGKVLIPGMIDAHAHVTGIGFAALLLDLSDTRSLE